MPDVGVLIPRAVEERFPGVVAAVDPRVEVGLVGDDGSVEVSSPPRVLLRGELPAEGMLRVLREHPTIEWLHVYSAGVEHFLPEIGEYRGVITNSAGLYAPPIAEWVIAMMLADSKRLELLFERDRKREWKPENTEELGGKTLGIIGAGGIGAEIARRARGLDMEVIGLRASGRPTEQIPRMYAPDALHEMLGLCDYVVLATPLTPQTEGLIGEPELRAMRPSAVLLNIARGKVVRTDALLRALREGWIAGAYLDVTDPEPLPPDHPLWEAPNVLITAHTSGYSPLGARRLIDFFRENLKRWLAGEELRNVVNRERGY